MKFKEIVTIATTVKDYVEKHKTLPEKTGGCNIGEYGYILTKSVLAPGKDIVKLAYSNAPAPNGDSINRTLTRNEFTSIATDVNKFVSNQKNKRLPNYDLFQGIKINIKLWIYCAAKIIVFYDKNKRLPNTCSFKSSVFTNSSSAKHTTKGGTVCKKLMNICKMSINNYTDVYNAMKKFTYNYYKNDQKTQDKTLSDMTGNCVDLNQIAFKALKELGYTVQIVRGDVKCNDNKWYGHVWCRIKLNNVYKNFDASAAAKGKSFGSLICSKGYNVTDINPSWAVSDDGRT